MLGALAFISHGAAADDGRDQAIRLYLECAKFVTPQLDDGRSEPGIIATGAHGRCRTAFVDVGLSLDRQNNLAEVLRPTLVQFVLMHRAALRPPPPAERAKPIS